MTMDNTSVVAEFMKQSKELEMLLQCPVCLELPTTVVSMCIRGHHVCVDCICSPSLQECPICQSAFNGTRNFLMKNLTSKILDMKHAILESACNVSQQNLGNKISVQTQTIDNIAVGVQSKGSSINEFKFKLKERIYPCKIRFCRQDLKYHEIIPHMKYYHKGNLIEMIKPSSRNLSYCWTIEYSLDKIFDKVIHVSKMGIIFFFNMTIHENGHVYGNVHVINRSGKSNYKYTINFTNNNKIWNYEGMVIPCRSFDSSYVEDQMDFFVNNKNMLDLLTSEKTFYCNLNLTKCKKDDKSFENNFLFKNYFQMFTEFFKNSGNLIFFIFLSILLNFIIRVIL